MEAFIPVLIATCICFTVSQGEDDTSSESELVPYRNFYQYDEYVIEHEISSADARNAALAIDLNSVKEHAGCQRCMREEIRYCLGSDLINDHCCCDMRYHETLSFIPHTCYVGKQVCKTVAADCTEYQRLRTCCCDKYTLIKWKLKATAPKFGVHIIGITSALMVYFIL